MKSNRGLPAKNQSSSLAYMPMGQTIGGDRAQTCFQTKVRAASGRVVVEQKDVLVGSPGDRRQNVRFQSGSDVLEFRECRSSLTYCVCWPTLFPTLTARWCYEVPLRSGYRSLAARIPPMGRVPWSAITRSLVSRPAPAKIAVTHRKC